jgi:hypothetical protein
MKMKRSSETYLPERRFEEARGFVRQVEEVRWALAVHGTSHPRASSVDFAHRLARELDTRRE